MGAAHRLVPFDIQAAPALRLEATARVIRSEDAPAQLQLTYRLSSLAGLRLPPSGADPRRCDGLWQHTCLEAFVGVPGGEAYWEFNLAPSGDWNVYRLDRYREGLQQEALYADLPFAIDLDHLNGTPVLRLDLHCRLPEEVSAAAELALGLSAVLEEQSGALSYWALHHPAAQADFHDRRGWVLRR